MVKDTVYGLLSVCFYMYASVSVHLCVCVCVGVGKVINFVNYIHIPFISTVQVFVYIVVYKKVFLESFKIISYL